MDCHWTEHEFDVADGAHLISRGYMLLDDNERYIPHDDVVDYDERFRVIPVAGESHHMEDLQSDAFAPGKPLRLVPEPENPYDKNAVKICDPHGRLHCGYLPRDLAATFAPLLRQGRRIDALSFFETVRADGARISLKILIGPNLDGQSLRRID